MIRIFNFLAWSSIFAVIYAQSPLYTSNQNQYFLHGLAQAGYGYLSQDWLANTLDPTPLFTHLVRLTYLIFQLDEFFYGYYALLMGVYIYSLLGITSLIFSLREKKLNFIFLAVILALHSAALRFFLTRAIGPEWTYLFEGGVAGQRVLGSVFQPSTFGVFLVLSIYLFLRGRVILALLVSALAVAFHPTYLLSTAMLTLVYMYVVFRDKKMVFEPIKVGLISSVLVFPVLIYVYSAFSSTPAATSVRAREILVNFRIPHHAVVPEWLDITVIFQLGFLFTALYLVRKTRLSPVLWICSLLAFILTVIQLISQDNALALLFPWRISVVLIPLSTSLIGGYLVLKLAPFQVSARPGVRAIIRLTSLGLIIFLTPIGATRFMLDLDRKHNSEERRVMDYVKVSKSPQDVYLIPIKMQDFRLATGAPVLVDFKSIPYHDEEVLEWYRRVQLVSQFYREGEKDCILLVDFFEREGVSHVVLEGEEINVECKGVVEKYRDERYQIYTMVTP